MGAEAELEKKTRDWCKKNGWKRKKMSSPGSRGTLDDYFLSEGRHVWIEMKAPGNTPTPLQWDEIESIREYGGEAFWADSLDQVKLILTTDRIEAQRWILECEYPADLKPQERYLL